MSGSMRRTLVVLCAFVASVVLVGVLRPAAAQSDGQAQRKGKFEVYQGRAGDFRWRLKSPNGQVIATGGQGYKDKRDCRNAVDSVKRLAADAPVEEVAPPAGEDAGAPDAAAGQRPGGNRPPR